MSNCPQRWVSQPIAEVLVEPKNADPFVCILTSALNEYEEVNYVGKYVLYYIFYRSDQTSLEICARCTTVLLSRILVRFMSTQPKCSSSNHARSQNFLQIAFPLLSCIGLSTTI